MVVVSVVGVVVGECCCFVGDAAGDKEDVGGPTEDGVCEF